MLCVRFCGFRSMMGRMLFMSMRGMCMMRGFLVIARLVMFGSFLVVTSCLLVVFGSFSVMFCCFSRHFGLPPTS